MSRLQRSQAIHKPIDRRSLPADRRQTGARLGGRWSTVGGLRSGPE
ncbi:MAG: hypothetical protein H6631_02310 [Anaerolineaceae bacterium]|nr:hypothetical protein [Anaerolineaceae bacterium]MCB9099936.1 hypothetical protein [Anaerolineales bacterium]